MRNFILILTVLAFGCSSDDHNEVISNRVSTYSLQPGSTFPISGTVVFTELVNGDLEIKIKLTGTEGDIYHPTHLHYGSADNLDAEMAALLDPVYGETGESFTVINHLNDESPFGYDELQQFEGHIKVHQDGGPNKSIILVIGNIGAAIK